MSATAELHIDRSNAGAKGGWRIPLGILGSVRNLVFGTLLCLTPVSAILVLGWFSRFSSRIIHQRVSGDLHGSRPPTGWIMDRTRTNRLGYWFGGLSGNLVEGVRITVALAAVTLPFTLIWLGAWWAGWENSFNKGYEQAFLGPTVFLIASLAGTVVLSLLPFGFCHVAYQRRVTAIFEWRRLYRLVRLAGWRYVAATFGFAFFALPLLASRALPVFYQDIIPGSADWDAQRMEEFIGQMALIKAAYVFLSLCLFRYLFARLYQRALFLETARSALWRSAMAPVYAAALLAIWGGFTFLLVMSQFMNMNWALWVNHPFILLPWMP